MPGRNMAIQKLETIRWTTDTLLGARSAASKSGANLYRCLGAVVACLKCLRRESLTTAQFERGHVKLKPDTAHKQKDSSGWMSRPSSAQSAVREIRTDSEWYKGGSTRERTGAGPTWIRHLFISEFRGRRRALVLFIATASSARLPDFTHTEKMDCGFNN